MNAEIQFKEMLRKYRFELKRQGKHLIYENPEGRMVTSAKTPSDYRAWENNIRNLKNALANPVPSSAVIEEERQRKELEQYIQLHPAKKAVQGGSGGGKKAKGTGIYYEPERQYKEAPVKVYVPLTPEQIEANLAAEKAFEERRIKEHWDKMLKRVSRQRKELLDDLHHVFGIGETVICVAKARQVTADWIKESRRDIRTNALKSMTDSVKYEESKQFLEEYNKSTSDKGEKRLRKLTLDMLKDGDVDNGAEMLFGAMQDDDIDPVYRFNDPDKPEQENVKDTAGRGFTLGGLLWSVGRFYKPSWLSPWTEVIPLPVYVVRALETILKLYPKTARAKLTAEAIRNLLTLQDCPDVNWTTTFKGCDPLGPLTHTVEFVHTHVPEPEVELEEVAAK